MPQRSRGGGDLPPLAPTIRPSSQVIIQVHKSSPQTGVREALCARALIDQVDDRCSGYNTRLGLQCLLISHKANCIVRYRTGLVLWTQTIGCCITANPISQFIACAFIMVLGIMYTLDLNVKLHKCKLCSVATRTMTFGEKNTRCKRSYV